jgi:hypothetical protein
VIVVLATLHGTRATNSGVDTIRFSESLDPLPARRTILDRLGLWVAIGAVLVLLAYGPPIWQLLQLPRFGSPAFRPF